MPTTPDRPIDSARGANGGLDARPPWWARAYVVVFAAAWLSFLGSFALEGVRERDAGALVVVPMAAFGIFLFSRIFLLRARTQGDVLVVRNSWRKQVIRRQDVEDVRTGKPQSGPLTFGESVVVLVRSGSMVSLEATLRLGWTAAGRRELTDDREQLLSWARRGAS